LQIITISKLNISRQSIVYYKKTSRFARNYKLMKPVIYQLLVRLFGNKSSHVVRNGTRDENGCGKFADIDSKALTSIRDLGATHIWYTGVIEHAVATDYSEYGIDNDYPEIVKGRAGSPYAIRDYYDVNPDLAVDVSNRMNEFQELVDRTHDAGMKVIMDFVPNHLARVYKSDAKPDPDIEDFGINDNKDQSFSINNDFYYIPGRELKLPDETRERAIVFEYRKNPVPYNEYPARATGNDCFSDLPGEGDWYETVKLNYGVDYLNNKKFHLNHIPPVWKKMKSIILYWAAKKIDGFRVDMAEMVPVEFWEWLIPLVKIEYPKLIFIAEIYQPGLYREFIERGGFDYLYDKVDFYETMRNIIDNKTDTRAITDCWLKIGDLENFMLRFLENHDEQRIASRFFAGDPWKGIPAMVLAATMNRGPVMLYFGQEVGEPALGCSGFSGDDGRTTIFDYWNVPNHQKWMSKGEFNGAELSNDLSELRSNYAGIIRLVNEYEIFAKGSFYDLMWVNEDIFSNSGGKVFAFMRHYQNNIALIIINLGVSYLKGLNLFIPDDAFRAAGINRDLKMVEKYLFPADTVEFQAYFNRERDIFIVDSPPLSASIFLFLHKST